MGVYTRQSIQNLCPKKALKHESTLRPVDNLNAVATSSTIRSSQDGVYEKCRGHTSQDLSWFFCEAQRRAGLSIGPSKFKAKVP